MTEQTLTPAQELRAAASKIRHLATRRGVPIGPWTLDADNGRVLASDDSSVFVTEGAWGRHFRTARHLMVWTPEVALALADWLDEVANIDEHGFRPATEAALKVSRSIFAAISSEVPR